MKNILLSLAIIGLTGCVAPHSFEELRSDPARVSEFIAPMSYQEAYRRVLPQARRCFTMPTFFDGGPPINAELYTDIGKGTIAFGRGNMLTVEIFEQGKQARVTVAAWGVDFRNAHTQVRKWVLDNSKDC